MTRGGVVHVVDDDDGVRNALASLLAASGLSVIPYNSAADFLDRVDGAPAGCVLTDVMMPEISGLDLLKRLHDRLAMFPVIVLTGEADVAMAVEALKNGAMDFIQKPFPAAAVVESVKAALRRSEADITRESRRSESAQKVAALSAREREVLDGLLLGQSNKEIARALDISPRTVEA